MSRFAQAALATLPPGGSRLTAIAGKDGKLGSAFFYCFRTPDGSETVSIGPLPMSELQGLAEVVEPVDVAMAKHMRHLLTTWRAEQAGLGGMA